MGEPAGSKKTAAKREPDRAKHKLKRCTVVIRRERLRTQARQGEAINKTVGPTLKKGGSGFTLLELMIVITIIAILAGIAIPIYKAVVLNAKETVLKTNLHDMRRVIDQYTADKKKAPLSLQDLVDAGYFREIPEDITGSNTSWETVNDTSVASPDQTESGIVDVRSGSTAISSEGTPYNTW